MAHDTPIAEFYDGKSIFVTGVTGFLGKVLLEALIRKCKVECVYILLRSKRGKSDEQPLEELVESELFSQCDKKKVIEKVFLMKGDITEDELGLSPEDRQRLVEQVSVVFHCTASVKFDEPLKESLTSNVKATKWILNLCKEMKNLKSFVHVSTAYAYCQRSISEEVIYPMEITAEKLMEVSELNDEDSFATSYQPYFEGRPNTYVFTKALAETYIKEHCEGVSVGIARPSIITATRREPMPGWNDTVNGIAGFTLLASLDICQTGNHKPNVVFDLIPADIVVNTLIAIGWYTGSNKFEQPRVFNITTGNVNPVTMEQFFKYGREAAIESPSNQMIWPIAKVERGGQISYLSHLFTQYISELGFAYLCDFTLLITGRNRRLFKIRRKMHQVLESEFFHSERMDLPL